MASDNKLGTADIEGGTITLSNIGAIGGKFGSPLLNLPEVAIIALGRIQKLPRFDDDGDVYPSSIINVWCCNTRFTKSVPALLGFFNSSNLDPSTYGVRAGYCWSRPPSC